MVNAIKELLDSELNIIFIFIIREEYYANLTEFEDNLPLLYQNRIRIEEIDKINVKDAILKPCDFCKVQVETNLPENIIEQLTKHTGAIELTWFQVLMDKLYKIAIERDHLKPILKINDLKKLGRIDKVLTAFLDEQLTEMDNGETGETVLKTMVSSDGTKRQMKVQKIADELQAIGKTIPMQELKNIIRHFTAVRILTDKDEHEFYELRHDSIAARIYERMTATEKELAEVRLFIQNAYTSYLQRNKLLDEKDLKYIAIYEDRIYLGTEIKQFLSRCKAEIHKVRKRRNTIFTVSAIVLLLIFTTFTVWALRERSKAKTALFKVEIERQKADSLYRQVNINSYLRNKDAGINFKDKEEFNKAIEKFEEARNFIDSTEIDTLINICEKLMNKEGEFNTLIEQAEKIENNESNWLQAIKIYEEALKLDYKNDFVKKKINIINNKINSKVAYYKINANKFLKTGNSKNIKDIALRRYILPGLKLKPNDKDLLNYKNTCEKTN